MAAATGTTRSEAVFPRDGGDQETAVHFGPGDTALLITDGITEGQHGSDWLGYQGMVQLARQSLEALSLQEAGKAILAGAHAFARGPLSDDAYLILARRR